MLTVTVNGEFRQFPQTLTIAGLLDALELAGKRVAVEHNGQIVPRSLHADTILSDGDALEIVAAVGGG